MYVVSGSPAREASCFQYQRKCEDRVRFCFFEGAVLLSEQVSTDASFSAYPIQTRTGSSESGGPDAQSSILLCCCIVVGSDTA